MIKNFKHKGLETFFLKGRAVKINQKHVRKLQLILGKLNTSVKINDMDFPGSHLHPLKGERKGFWAVDVSGNWRIIFRFENENAFDVDYVDYH
jgi:proteic killer suppression protein